MTYLVLCACVCVHTGLFSDSALVRFCDWSSLLCPLPYFFVPAVKGPIHSVKVSEFTVWRHTWRKKLVNCAVLTGNSAGLWTDLSSRLSHRAAQFTQGIPVSSFYLPAPRWHHLKAHPFPVINSANEHRMIYSFSNNSSFSIFYAFFSSFRITIWPMWLANSKRQPCFYPP